MITFDELSHVVLVKMYMNLLQDKSSIELGDYCDSLPSNVPSSLIARCFDELKRKDYVDYETNEIGNLLINITNNGIRYAERLCREPKNHIQQYLNEGNKYLAKHYGNLFQGVPIGNDGDENAWKKSDELGEIDSSNINRIQQILQECLEKIDKANLNQQDKADARHKIKSAQEMAEAPRPYLGVIHKIISPFANSFLGEAAKEIAKRISGNS